MQLSKLYMRNGDILLHIFYTSIKKTKRQLARSTPLGPDLALNTLWATALTWLTALPRRLQLPNPQALKTEPFHNFGTKSHLVAKPDRNSCKPFKPFIDPTDVTAQAFL